jgi:molybdopterin converting factor small subunit
VTGTAPNPGPESALEPKSVTDPARSGSAGSALADSARYGGLVTVRYFAAARAAAGTTEEKLSVDGPLSLDDLATILGELHGPELARVLGSSSFLVDATSGPRGRIVQLGSVVDVLPPFAGG